MTGSSYSFKSSALAVLALTASAWAQAVCYTVYDAKNEVIYRSAEPPVDMSKPLHQTANELPSGSRVVIARIEGAKVYVKPAGVPAEA